MFRAILCPSSGAQEYYTDGRCLWYLVLWFSGCRYGVELKVMCPVCRLLQAACKLETCWVCNKICNKYNLLHLVGILFPHNNYDARSKSLQICFRYVCVVWNINERHAQNKALQLFAIRNVITNWKQDCQCKYNVILRQVRATILAVEKCVCVCVCVCVCSLRYPARNAHAPYCHL